MDPVSFAASIASLSLAYDSVGKIVRKLRGLKNAPASYQAFYQEFSDFKDYFEDVKALSARYVGHQNDAVRRIASLGNSISRAKERLDAVGSQLSKVTLEDLTKVKRIRWVLEDRVINHLRDEMRAARLELGGAVSIMLLIPESPQVVSNQANAVSIQQQSTTNQMLVSAKTDVTVNFANDSDTEQNSSRHLMRSQLPQKSLERISDQRPSIEDILEPSLHRSAKSAYTITRQDQHCVCSCICHRTYRYNTPQSLMNYLGAIYVSHSGFPALSTTCDDPYCKEQATPFGSLTWHFPPWFLGRIAAWCIRYKPSPELILRLPRVIKAGSPVFHATEDGDIERLSSLLNSGQASVIDVTSTNRMTALSVAVIYNRLEVCEYLLMKGADPYLQDLKASSAYDEAWNRILSRAVRPEDQDRLRVMFGDQSKLEARQFSKLHKAVLGMVHINLEQELSMTAEAFINRKDANGRTPLSWAAVRGDVTAAQILIKYGADPNSRSNREHSCLHYAVQSGNIPLIKLLLDAGAAYEQPNDNGQAPIHLTAYFHDRVELAEILLDRGAQVDPQNNTGATPLICAVQYNRPEILRYLIARGADYNATITFGWTALTFAVVLNHHECIEILLQNPVNAKNIDQDGGSLPHLVAKFADMRCLQMVANHLSCQFCRGDRRKDGMTAEEILSRRDTTTEYRDLFRKLFSED